MDRSTLANVEAGRQRLSGRLRQRILEEFPSWISSVDTGRYNPARGGTNAGLEVLDLTISYVFLHSLSPSEIIQVRRVRALRSGVRSYALGLRRDDGQPIRVETQELWGGTLREELIHDSSDRLSVFEFPRPLNVDAVHEFAMRSWLEQDADPCTEVRLGVTMPVRRAAIHVASHGPHGIAQAWRLGPAADLPIEDIAPDSPLAGPLAVSAKSVTSAVFKDLPPGMHCGLGWRWQPS